MDYETVPEWLRLREKEGDRFGVCAHIGYRKEQQWNVWERSGGGLFVCCFREGCNDALARRPERTLVHRVRMGIRVR